MRFWNQEYSDWGEVTTPRNPRSVVGNVLDYARFFNDSNVSFLKEQYNIIRQHIPSDVWISTNSTAMTDRGINHFDYHRAMDIAGWDAYYGAAGNPYPEDFAAFTNDMMRSIKNMPFIVFETNTTDIKPAYLAEIAARGAKMIIFWHWRMHRFNSEATAQAFCDHAGNPIEKNTANLKNIVTKISGSVHHNEKIKPSEFIFIHSIDDFRAVQREYARWQRKPYLRIPFLDSLVTTYAPFRRFGIRVDIREPNEYKIIENAKFAILPQTEIVSAKFADSIRKFVKNGGILFASGIIGIKDEYGVFYPNGKEPLNDVFGLRIEHVSRDNSTKIIFQNNEYDIENNKCSAIASDISAEISGTFAETKKPAIFRNYFGKGKVYYMAACSKKLAVDFAKFALSEEKIKFHDNLKDELAIFPDLKTNSIWKFDYENNIIFKDDKALKI